MTVGYFGPVKFETSDKRVLTFTDLNRSSSSRIAVHDTIGRKPTSEFIGPNLDSVTFTVTLNASLGVKPKDTADKFLKMNRSGEVHPLVIGKQKLGMDKWIITAVSQAWGIVMKQGQLYSCQVDITLQEYVAAMPPAIKPIAKKIVPIKIVKKKKGLGTATIKVGMLNLRTGPSMKYRIVRVLRKGQKYTVYAMKNGWYDLGSGQWASNVGNKYMTYKKH